MTSMNLDTWLQRIETFHPQAIKLGLERIRQIAAELQVTNFSCPVITIGGTNGKGSCVKILESILTQAGYRVGAYTSPHLLKFNERIRINNEYCSDEDLIVAFEHVQEVAQNVSLTFFEFTTLAALWLFKNANLNVLLLEVGLGGRLDAVNIVESDVAVITSIDFDHMDWLGETREAIGFEKAGIFRRDKSAVIGEVNPPMTLFSKAEELGTTLFCVNNDFAYQEDDDNWQWQDGVYQWFGLPKPALPLQNAATALKVISLLKKNLTISESAIHTGLLCAYLMGRFQELDPPFSCIVDVAHNPASARHLAQKCRALHCPGNLIAVVGMLKDKDIANTLQPLQPLVSQWFCGSLHVPRGASASEVAASLTDIDSDNCYTYDYIIDAFKAATRKAQAQDKILVFGSFYTVAEVLQFANTVRIHHEELM